MPELFLHGGTMIRGVLGSAPPVDRCPAQVSLGKTAGQVPTINLRTTTPKIFCGSSRLPLPLQFFLSVCRVDVVLSVEDWYTCQSWHFKSFVQNVQDSKCHNQRQKHSQLHGDLARPPRI